MSEPKTESLPQRLCSEIQLFDLCEKDSCRSRNGRFCTDLEMLTRFEKIADEEFKAPERYISEDPDAEGDADSCDNYDEFASEDVEDSDDDGWEDEE